MKKFFVFSLIFALTSTSCLAWSFNWKKDKTTPTETSSEPVEIPEYDNYGSGYKGGKRSSPRRIRFDNDTRAVFLFGFQETSSGF